jgi:hypothetical protein
MYFPVYIERKNLQKLSSLEKKEPGIVHYKEKENTSIDFLATFFMNIKESQEVLREPFPSCLAKQQKLFFSLHISMYLACLVCIE